MPTDHSPMPWTHLAEAAVLRLRGGSKTAAHSRARASGQDAPLIADTLTLLRHAAVQAEEPAHLHPAEIEAIRAAGEDPRRIDSGGRDRSEVHIPFDDLLVALRLAATLGTSDRRDAMLADGAVTLIEVADKTEVDTLSRAAHALLPPDWCSTTRRGAPDKALRVQTLPVAGERPATTEAALADLRDALSERAPILCVSDDFSALPAGLRGGLSPVPLAPLDTEILLALMRATHSGTGVLDEAPLRAALPPDAALARIDSVALLLAFRAPTPAEVVRRVSDAAQPPVATGPTLADITGYGAAEAQARRMVRDLREWQAGEVGWDEVERSVILYGQPGTGKSFLARAMAGEAGVGLVRGSFAAWQANGHLGDMLRAMRDSFAEARRSAPCIFILDEIDAVGSRDSGDRHGKQYSRQIINGFLQELDALAQMEGVLVVGTCNAIHEIDPAVLRPGRFDRHVHVPVPGRSAVSRMIRAAFPDASDARLASAVRAATGLTAAVIDGAIRAARATARDREAMATPDDLLDQLADRTWPADIAWRISFHEAGHAVVAHALDLGEIERIALTPDGGEIHTQWSRTHGLLADHQARLACQLAGRAAETLILDSPSSGAGGSAASDLAKATQLAADIEQRYGLGRAGLVWDRPVEGLETAIESRLREAEATALEILRDRQPILEALATRLQNTGLLEAEEISELLDGGVRAGKVRVDAPACGRDGAVTAPDVSLTGGESTLSKTTTAE